MRFVALTALLTVASAVNACKQRQPGGASGVKGLAAGTGDGPMLVLFADEHYLNICRTTCDASLLADVAAATGPVASTPGRRYCEAVAACRSAADFYLFWRGLGMTDQTTKAALLGNVFDEKISVRLPPSIQASGQSDWQALGEKLPAITSFFAERTTSTTFDLAREAKVLATFGGLLLQQDLTYDRDPNTKTLADAAPDVAQAGKGRFLWKLTPGSYLKANINPMMSVRLEVEAPGDLSVRLAITPQAQPRAGDANPLLPPEQATIMRCDGNAPAEPGAAPESRVTTCRQAVITKSNGAEGGLDLTVLSQTAFRLAYWVRPPGAAAVQVQFTDVFKLIDPQPDAPGARRGTVCNFSLTPSQALRSGADLGLDARFALDARLAQYQDSANSGAVFVGDAKPDLSGALLSACDACLANGARQFLKLAGGGGADGMVYACAAPECYSAPDYVNQELAVIQLYAAQRAAGFRDAAFRDGVFRRCSAFTGRHTYEDQTGPFWRVTPGRGIEFSAEEQTFRKR